MGSITRKEPTTMHAIGTVLENRNTGKRVRIADTTTYPGSVVVNWGQSADDPVSIPISAHVFDDTIFDWRVVEPYECGTCGHRFYEETPAGRCPNEADHEEPESTDPIFRVYAIAEGAVDGEEWEGDDYTDALLKFSEAFNQYNDLRDRGLLECEVTLHLYEPAWGNLLHERTITRAV